VLWASSVLLVLVLFLFLVLVVVVDLVPLHPSYATRQLKKCAIFAPKMMALPTLYLVLPTICLTGFDARPVGTHLLSG